MNAAVRLRAAQLGALAGSLLALLGVVIAWFTVTREGRTLEVPDLGTVPFPGQQTSVNGFDLGAGLPALAVMVVVAAGLALLGARRTSGIALALAAAGSIGLIVLSVGPGTAEAIAAAPPSSGSALGDPVVSASAGRALTIAAAAVTIVAAGWGIPVAARVRAMPMPERGPSA